MKTLEKRRIANIVTAMVVCCALLWFFQWQRSQLKNASFTSGYFLLAAVLFLTAYNWRKRLTVVPLGSSAFWLQLHIYIGFSSIAVFLAHIGFRWPNGMFETTLAAAFAIVASSGIYGLYLSRSVPKKLSQLNDEVIYERVPALRTELANSATQLAFESVNVTQATTVAEFYSSRLSKFFMQPRGVWYSLFPSSRRRRKLMDQLSQMQRFCSADEKRIAEQMFSLIRKKDDLDYQFALQHKLKLWLFLHIGFTYMLLVFSLFHTVMVHAFHGGMR